MFIAVLLCMYCQHSLAAGEKMRAQCRLEGGEVVEFEKDVPTPHLKEVI